jgi:hypothetical protein
MASKTVFLLEFLIGFWGVEWLELVQAIRESRRSLWEKIWGCEGSKARGHQESDIVWTCLAVWLFPKLISCVPYYWKFLNIQVLSHLCRFRFFFSFLFSFFFLSFFFILCLEY